MRHSYVPTFLVVALVAIALGIAHPLQAALIGVQQGNVGNVYALDTTTGSQTLIGNSGIPQLQALALSPSGTYYATAGTTGAQQLVTINPTTGAGSVVAPITANSGGTLSFMTGIAFADNGTLYGVGIPTGSTISNLYTINSTSGAATLIGSTNATSMQGLDVSPTGTLYGYNVAGSTGARGLHTIDPATGNATFVGPSGGSGLAIQSLVFTPDGALWGSTGGGGTTGSLYTIDPVTGGSTLQFNGLAFRGIEYLAPVPVPAAVWLFGSGMASLIGLARRKVATGPQV